MNKKRAAGILLPISSLPSKYGIGCFSKSAYEFVDQLKTAGQSYWQILPLGPTGYGNSPYQSFSTFAGNPYFVSLEDLIEEGVLTKEECEKADFGADASAVDYGKLYAERFVLLRKAYERSRIFENPEFLHFCQQSSWWLDDYALFMAVKGRFGGKSWIEWAEDIRLRYGFALDYYRRELYYEIEFYKYIQFKFQEQWHKLKKYANEQGIQIIGDIPIYVAFDSSDTWANPQLYQLDENNLPLSVAGCPPDAFSETGQLWGNPLYRWDYHKNHGYDWWVKRVEHCFKMYDVVRIDHFRGFDEYYSIPYGDKTAENGHWEQGPGMDLFHTITKRLGEKRIIAEDLGFMTDTVRKLVKDSGYPNMKVLEFAFESDDEDNTGEHLPHNYEKNCVVYTGTHDNDTLFSWYENLDPDLKKKVRAYLHKGVTEEKNVYKDVIYLVMASVANTCVIPMQDYLGCSSEARMNTPSTLGENWKWRLKKDEITNDLLQEILDITRLYGRYHKKSEASQQTDIEMNDMKIKDAKTEDLRNKRTDSI